jgi:hypothetical protein
MSSDPIPDDMIDAHRSALEELDNIAVATTSLESGDWPIPSQARENLDRIRESTARARGNVIAAMSVLADLVDETDGPAPEDAVQ